MHLFNTTGKSSSFHSSFVSQLLCFLLILSIGKPVISAETTLLKLFPNETTQQRDARMKWWREARFSERRQRARLQGRLAAEGPTEGADLAPLVDEQYGHTRIPRARVIDRIAAFAAATALLYVARQRDLPNQRSVDYLSIEPAPDRVVSKDIDGNAIEFWDLSDQVETGEDIAITRHFRFNA